MNDSEFRHLYRKAIDALSGGLKVWNCFTVQEQCAVAIVLNRADWLDLIGYTLVEAIERAGPVWVSLMPRVVRSLANEQA